MIRSFKDKGSADIFEGIDSKAARRKCPRSLWGVAARKLEQIDSALTLKDLRIPPGNRLEALSGNLIGQFSIRVNEQYRICFAWTDTGPGNVEIVDYH
jgi:proteic killer suppression protein